MEFEAVIGLEVHTQLATRTKIFCACPANATDGVSVSEVDVNAQTCPVCTGHPGTLPVLNKKVAEFAVMAGLATNCSIRPHSVFSRKNYFYPDLPKGYQISQYDLPICEGGHLDIETKAGTKRIRIQRIHIEEDAGKNIHMAGFSLVNLNRACVPLLEIVSEPDIRSAEEASAYLKSLHAVVTYLGICDGNMQEGNFRCDANVSVRPKGTEKFGTRAEVKNVNSFRFIEKAIEFEIKRQSELIRSGGKVIQETRGYDSAKNTTFSLRSKEEAHDYRYFPEPDLIPLKIQEAQISQVRGMLPELPHDKKSRFVKELGLSSYDASVLTQSKEMAKFFEETVALLSKDAAKTVSNFITGEVARILNEGDMSLGDSKCPLQPKHVADLTKSYLADEISSTGAKQVIVALFSDEHKDKSVADLINQMGLKQVSDTSALIPAIEKVIAANPGQVAEFKAGKDKLLGFFVGQVMKETGGKANPALLQNLIREKLK